MLEMTSEIRDGVIIVRPVGRIDSVSSKDFEEKAVAHIETTSPRIVLDLAKLDYISSAGLRVILTAAKKAKALGGALTLCSVQPGVHEVLVISGFVSLLGIHTGLEEAFSALK